MGKLLFTGLKAVAWSCLFTLASTGNQVYHVASATHPLSLQGCSMPARMILAMLVALSLLPACAQEPWQKYNDAGLEATEQARYAEAEDLFLEALKEAEKFGDQDPRLATILNNLALLYREQGKFPEAEPLHQRALAIREKALAKVYGNTRQQRCWVHKTGNVLNCLPKVVQPRAKQALHQIWMAATRQDAYRAFDEFIATYQLKFPKATACLAKDRIENVKCINGIREDEVAA